MDNREIFDVSEMVNNFDMRVFFTGRRKDDKINGFVLITNNQCITGYTYNRGRGFHDQAFVSALAQIYDLEKSDYQDITTFDMKTDKDFIKARLINYGDRVYISFTFALLEGITPNQLALFEKFKDKYNSIIRFYSHYYGKPIVNVVIPNYLTFEYSDLEEVFDYLKTIVNDKKELPEDKNIIGKIILQPSKKR